MQAMPKREARPQRRIDWKAALERIEDVARVLKRLALGRHDDGDEAEPRALHDHVPVGLGGGEELDEGQALEAQSGRTLAEK